MNYCTPDHKQLLTELGWWHLGLESDEFIIQTMTKVYNENTARLEKEREKQEEWLKETRKYPITTYAYGPTYPSLSRFPNISPYIRPDTLA